MPDFVRTELRCPCGATWRWWGRPGEADGLMRLWAKEHRACGFVLKENT